MGQSASRETEHRSATQEISRFYGIQGLLLCLQEPENGPHASNPVRNHRLYFFKTYFNGSLPSMSGLPNDIFPSDFPTKILHAFLVSSMRATYLAILR